MLLFVNLMFVDILDVVCWWCVFVWMVLVCIVVLLCVVLFGLCVLFVLVYVDDLFCVICLYGYLELDYIVEVYVDNLVVWVEYNDLCYLVLYIDGCVLFGNVFEVIDLVYGWLLFYLCIIDDNCVVWMDLFGLLVGLWCLVMFSVGCVDGLLFDIYYDVS